jgi:magnesium transporter
LRDCYDHVVQIMDVLETYRETAAGLMEVHLSSVANRTNEVMKVLTVISSIFIPLTFIVGVYGMNFDYMPELRNPAGYPLVWLVMIALGLGMLVYFWRRGWIGRGQSDEPPAPTR